MDTENNHRHSRNSFKQGAGKFSWQLLPTNRIFVEQASHISVVPARVPVFGECDEAAVEAFGQDLGQATGASIGFGEHMVPVVG